MTPTDSVPPYLWYLAAWLQLQNLWIQRVNCDGLRTCRHGATWMPAQEVKLMPMMAQMQKMGFREFQ